MPPSYRARNNLLRIPNLMSGNGNGSGHHPTADTTPNNNGAHNGNRIASTLTNVNGSPNMGTITETRAIITSANQRHQQQMQLQLQQQQQHEHNRCATTLPDTNENSISDTIANNSTKIIQSACNDENRTTGILAGVRPMLAKQSLSGTMTTTSAPVQSKLPNANTDLHDIDRLFLNSSHTIGDNGHLMNSDGSFTNADDTKTNRNDLVTIVTISGCTTTESSTGEMDILAHL